MGNAMGRVSIIGVLVGATFDVVASPLLAFLISFAWIKFVVGDAATVSVSVGNGSTLSLLSIGLYSIGLLVSVMAGWIAARIAKRAPLLNGTLSSIFCVSLGVFALSKGTSHHSLAWQLVVLLISPLLGTLGGYLSGVSGRPHGAGLPG